MALNIVVSERESEYTETQRLMMNGADMKLSLRDLIFVLVIVVSVCPKVNSDDGYDLWMSYKKLDDAALLGQYRQAFSFGQWLCMPAV